MELASAAFEQNGRIPSKYTCDGENINPPLNFGEVPQAAKSLVLIVDDPDVPKHVRPDGLWVHWLVWNMPPATRTVAENSVPQGVEGTTSFGKPGYGGPCPPDREHRYFFKLYALDILLDLPPTANRENLEEAMKDHTLMHCELIGLYDRKR